MARKILLADDSVTAQNMGRKILSDAGYEVIAVNNGSAALKKIAELKPDLVILDVYMPGYSGLEVCQRLKESPETARIPVLLSVGKLEPFKPQEAQRVRADAYIVKPFEASELLSALAKLEDKIVPRAEDSKHARFARTSGSTEVSGGVAEVAANEAAEWKRRISSPRKKTEPEAGPANEAEIYNIVNRDLRTVVESSAERATAKQDVGKEAKGEKEYPAVTEAEASVDNAVLAPSGLPKDVTSEEIAAIAAAAAQMQMAVAILKEEPQASESSHALPKLPCPEPVKDFGVEDHRSEEIRSEEARGKEISPEPLRREEARPEETHDDPVTMAAATNSTMPANAVGTRWMAVPVPLGSEEAALSLEQEMQPFAASEPISALVQTEPQASAPLQTYDLASAIAQEIPVALIPNSEPKPVFEIENSVSPVAVEVLPVQIGQTEGSIDFSLSSTQASQVSESTSSAEPHEISEIAPGATEMPSPEISNEAQSSSEFVQVHQEPTPVAEFTSSGVENQGTYTRFAEAKFVEAQIAEPGLPQDREGESTPVVESPSAEAASESKGAFAAIVRDPEPAAETKLDPEAVKSTAAAWASWRQIRDIGQASPANPPTEEEIGAPAPPRNSTAMAVAAGAEHISQESSNPALDRHSAEVASIVDSVLADLRPKLMEEISRKMAQKK